MVHSTQENSKGETKTNKNTMQHIEEDSKKGDKIQPYH